MESLNLQTFNWWNEYHAENLTLHSENNCHFRNSAPSYLRLAPYYLFSNRKRKVNVLDTSIIIETISNNLSSTYQSPLPAVEIKDMSMNIHAISTPVVDVNATGIVINIVTQRVTIPVSSKIEIPITTVRIGNWTLDELFNMIPPAPKGEGSYPKLGTLNLTNVKIISHCLQGNTSSSYEVPIPNEFFYPLYQLTNLAGANGTDQLFITKVIMKSIIMVLRKHLINDDHFVSKSMESFLSSMEKSTEVVHEISDYLEGKMNEWTGFIDNEMVKLNQALNQFILKVEEEWNEASKEENFPLSKLSRWNEALEDENCPLSKLSRDVWNMREKTDMTLFCPGHHVKNLWEKVEDELTIVRNELLPQLTKDVKDGLNGIQTTIKEAEIEINNQFIEINTIAKTMEDSLDLAVERARKDLWQGVNKAKEYINDIFNVTCNFS